MTVHTPTVLRPAVPADARFLARMIDIAGEGIPAWVWSQSAEPGQRPLDVGEARAQRDGGGFSYRNALVAEQTGEPAGMLLGYVIGAPSDADRAEAAFLPAPIRPFVELEHLAPDTWYINALAVRPGRRGRGVGTRLMRAAEERAHATGVETLSIQVFSQNTDALRLYERLGYRAVASRPVLEHPCQPYYDADVLLLTKPVGRG